MKQFQTLSSFILIVLALTACDGLVDNQVIVNDTDRALVNPAPVERPFVENNQKHKVLLGVIDTGVDYNHPLLLNNIHFTLDAAKKPVGAGFDFTGLDTWPAPYVARTGIYDPTLDERTKAAADAAYQVMKTIRQKASDNLKALLPLSRHVTQEYSSGAYHGTHVAGLMVYDRPDFGLLSYRVIPQNRMTTKDFDYNQDAVTKIIAAIDKAATDGAQIINMSLGMESQRAVKGEDPDENVRKHEQFLQIQKSLADTISKYPKTLFVVAAGNENSWKDGLNLTGLPCGIKLPNVLCVGALREDGSPTPFTNMIISGADVVFALGKNVLSTVPAAMCIDKSIEALVMLEMTGSFAKAEDYDTAVSKMEEGCKKQTGLAKLSGTSMASPLVAHLAAEILSEQPTLDAKGLIQAIYKQAIPSYIGVLPVYKTKIKKPSWYSQPTFMGIGRSQVEYWDGYINRPAK